MKQKALIILASLLTVSHFGWTQLTFNYGPELGLSFSKFPIKVTRTIRTDKVTESTIPLFSPLLGFHSQLTIINHFVFTAGLQYQMTGQRDHYHRDGRIPRDYSIPVIFTYTHDVWEQQTFHKLCFPLTAGYTFNIGEFKPAIFIGFRPNSFLTGKYYYKSVFDASDNSKDQTRENEYNPVDPGQAGEPVKRLQNQLLIGLAVSCGSHFKISLNYSHGNHIYYAEHQQTGWEPYFTRFKNSDFGLSLTYFIKPLAKKDESETGE